MQDVDEIFAMRTCLEQFAFEQIWDRRDDAFKAQLSKANSTLKTAIDASAHVAAIEAELDLHGLAYEHSGNRLLLNTWTGLRGHLQMYWAAHHNAHGTKGPRRESHDRFVQLALGDSLQAMQQELRDHMHRGLETTRAFIEARKGAEPAKAKP